MLFLLFGSDSFRLREKLHELKEKFMRDVDESGINLTTINSDRPKIDEIKKAITVSSFLAKKRMVVIENVFQGKDKILQKNLLDILKEKRLLKDTIIILVEEIKIDPKTKKPKTDKTLVEILDICDYQQEFNLLNEGELSSWTKK